MCWARGPGRASPVPYGAFWALAWLTRSHRVYWPAFTLGAIFAAAGPPVALAKHAPDGYYLVVDVLAGDIIRVLAPSGDVWTVRYAGVDAPDIDPPRRGADCWAFDATQRNRELLLGSRVYLEQDTSDVDRFGRLLRYVWLEDELIQSTLLRAGHVRSYPLRPDTRRAEGFAALESRAREEQRGQWMACSVLSGFTDLDEPDQGPRGVEYGANVFIYGEPETTARDLAKLGEAQLGWQKSLFQWQWIEIAKGVFNWVEADRVVAASNEAGVKILARPDSPPSWAYPDPSGHGPPERYEDFADFVHAFVDRYKPGSPHGTVAAVQLWNEPNLTREWGWRPISRQSAAEYVHLLCLSREAAKRASREVRTVTAALAPTGTRTREAMDDTTYLQWMYDSSARGCFDILGAPGAGYKAPPWVGPSELATSAEWGRHPSFGFRRVEQLRQVMVANGDAPRQIWLSEFGWTSDQTNASYAWHRVSEEEKARYIVEAFHWASQNWRPWIGVMFVWNLASPSWTPRDEEYWWSITNPDGSNRPAFEALVAARATRYLH